MRHKFQFIRAHKEFEPICEATAFNKQMIDEYKLKEQNRSGTNNRVVYDCMDNNSPFYPNGEYVKMDEAI